MDYLIQIGFLLLGGALAALPIFLISLSLKTD